MGAKLEKEFKVVSANTAVDEDAVVVHHYDASVAALAVVSSFEFFRFTLLARFKRLGQR